MFSLSKNKRFNRANAFWKERNTLHHHMTISKHLIISLLLSLVSIKIKLLNMKCHVSLYDWTLSRICIKRWKLQRKSLNLWMWSKLFLIILAKKTLILFFFFQGFIIFVFFYLMEVLIGEKKKKTLHRNIWFCATNHISLGLFCACSKETILKTSDWCD